MSYNVFSSIRIFIIIALLVILTFSGMRPPEAPDENASDTVFSSERAFRHIEAISREPRPTGTPQIQQAAEYITGEITALGLTPEMQETTVFQDRLWTGGRVRNIITKIEGTDSTGAIMLMGHYDSVPTAPGASDNGSAVGTMLETMRLLVSGEPLKNDVIFMFPDAEEVGLLGAKAFKEQHPLSDEVTVVLNIEARGTSGPSIMFQSSQNNAGLISVLNRAVSRPVGNSMSNEIYNFMPNDTDLTIFLNQGYHGLNFAYIDDPAHYHAPLDNLENLDKNSLQHHGEYILPLVKTLGNMDLIEIESDHNAVYFDLLGRTLVNYPERWGIPLAILAAAMMTMLLWYGSRRQKLSFEGIFLGLLSILVSVLAVGGLISLIWHLSKPFLNMEGHLPPYNLDTFFTAFAVITLSVIITIYYLFGQKALATEMFAGGLIGWTVAAVLSALYLPGIGYLFIWPLLFALGVLLFLLKRKSDDLAGKTVSDFKLSPVYMGLLALTAAAGILLWLPSVYLIFVAISSMAPAAPFVLLAILLVLLYPHLEIITPVRRWAIPTLILIAGIIIYGVAMAGARPSADRPWMNMMFYHYNADTGEAMWINPYEENDEWTEQFFAEDGEWRFIDHLKIFYLPELLTAPAPVPSKGFLPPGVELLEDVQIDEDMRELRLLITTPRRAPIVNIHIDDSAEVVESFMDGMELDPELLEGLSFYSLPPEGMELLIRCRGEEPVDIIIYDHSYELPAGEGFDYEPRPSHFIKIPSNFCDSTLVSKTYQF